MQQVLDMIGGIVKGLCSHFWYGFVTRRAAREPVPCAYGSHIPVLISLSRLIPVRTVLEAGSGLFSTPLFLDRSVFPEVTRVDSLENDIQWLAKVKSTVGSDTRLHLQNVDGRISDHVMGMDLTGYDVILVDDSSSVRDRAETIKAVGRKIVARNVVAIHDFEVVRHWLAGLAFRHRFRFDAFNPNTGVVWSGDRVTNGRLRTFNSIMRRNAGATRPDDTRAWAEMLPALKGVMASSVKRPLRLRKAA